mmetsp:Transcript_3291/g.9551  ORF Transcript_3291/g.9551 Transcript_3291/m.9551 type:complete len:342 (-) Transcript_3291:370-1395(-)
MHARDHPLPHPLRDNDWLALIAEKGQTYSEYLQAITLRSGRFKPHACADAREVCLVPIAWRTDKQWRGPPLSALREIAEAYFGVPVRVLGPARVGAAGDRVAWWDPRLGADGASDSAWDSATPRNRSASTLLPGRDDGTSGRSQLLVDPILVELARLKSQLRTPFAVVGLTMADLYSAPSDLFVAGMAAPAAKVGIISLLRYDPRIRMSDTDWWDYGFNSSTSFTSGSAQRSPYFDEGKRPKTLKLACFTMPKGRSLEKELMRRAARLLVHELMHLYGLEHCVHHSCIMQGSGHLVEDYEAPLRPCAICLRKLSFRLGFGCAHRMDAVTHALAKHEIAARD